MGPRRGKILGSCGKIRRQVLAKLKGNKTIKSQGRTKFKETPAGSPSGIQEKMRPILEKQKGKGRREG